MNKIWYLVIFLLICLGVLVVAKVYPPAETALADGFAAAIASIGGAWASLGAMLNANAFYAQYSNIIIFALGMISTVIIIKVLWPRRPTILAKAKEVAPAYQHQPLPSLPQTVPEQATQVVAKPKVEETKTEEAPAQ